MKNNSSSIRKIEMQTQSFINRQGKHQAKCEENNELKRKRKGKIKRKEKINWKKNQGITSLIKEKCEKIKKSSCW